MRKLLSILFAAALLLSLSGCVHRTHRLHPKPPHPKKLLPRPR